jgi:hypothetical protein
MFDLTAGLPFLIALLFLLGANVYTHAGKAITTARLKGSGSEPNWIGWGTGAGTALVSDTTLFTEASEARVAGTSSQQQTTQPNDCYRVVGTLTVAGAGKTITNAGLFDQQAVGGNMLVKGDFAGIALNVGESIQFTFNLTFA